MAATVVTDNNKVKFGLSNVHYAVLTETVSEGVRTISYGTPKPIPGAVNLNIQPEGDLTPFRADNIDYWVGGGNNGYSGDVELARITDEFKVDCLGEAVDATTTGLQYEVATAQPVPFALLFEFEGDAKHTRHVLYNCKAGRPTIASETTPDGNIEPITETLSITAKPRSTDSLGKAKSVVGDTSYATFFRAVVVPSVS